MLRIPPRRTSGFGPARFASPRRPRTTIAVYKFGVPPLTTGAGQCGAGSRTASLEAGYVSGAHVTAIVELAFGKIKQGRGFRQFLFRAMRKRRGDWALIVHHRLARTSSPHRGLDRPRYKASCASASCDCHAESLLIEYECGSREGTRRAQSHVEEGRSLGLRTEGSGRMALGLSERHEQAREGQPAPSAYEKLGGPGNAPRTTREGYRTASTRVC